MSLEAGMVGERNTKSVAWSGPKVSTCSSSTAITEDVQAAVSPHRIATHILATAWQNLGSYAELSRILPGVKHVKFILEAAHLARFVFFFLPAEGLRWTTDFTVFLYRVWRNDLIIIDVYFSVISPCELDLTRYSAMYTSGTVD